jgi:flagellar biosynthetic protein FliO
VSGGPPEIGLGALAVVGLVLALAAGVHRWLRARGPAADERIRVLACRALGPRRALALVEVEGERWLLGLTDAGIARLGRLGRAPARPRLRAAAGEEAA